ncbi:MAG: 30S ribosome-binding factor RbfA [Proteobacteria bacterium]|nr:30S ribosome-binding factor RbfA [Pseudomonadota bacterium]
MKSQRQLQIGENLKRVMSEIFLREDILTVPGSYITILEADVSPDAKNARIFIDIFGNDKVHEKIIEKLNDMVPFFRHQMAKRITLRVVPEIIFMLDKTQSKALSLEALLNEEARKYNEQQPKIKKPRAVTKKKK